MAIVAQSGVKRSFYQAFELPADREDPAKKTASEVELLPEELLPLILRELPAQDLARAQNVCRYFRQTISDSTFLKSYLEITIPAFKVNFFDKADWVEPLERLGLSADGMVSINYLHAIFEVQKLVLRLKEKNLSVEGDAGVTVMTLPANLREVLLGYLANRAEEDKRFKVICDPYMQLVMESIPPKKSYSVIMTNSILETTRNGYTRDHDRLLEKIQCVRPGVLEVAALVVMTYDRSIPSEPMNSLFFQEKKYTSTRCRIEADKMTPLTVGVFGGDDEVGPFLSMDGEPGPVNERLRSPTLAKGPQLGIAAAFILNPGEELS